LRFYLKKRGINELVNKLGIGFLDGFYIFPVYDPSGDIIGLVARAGQIIQDSYAFRYTIPKGQPPLLYSTDWKIVQSSSYLYLTYGIFDAITLSLCGFPAVSGTTGHKLTKELFQDIRKKIYIIEDGDGQDHQSAIQLAINLGWRGKPVQPDYPQGTKDMNEVLVKYGKEAVISLINKIPQNDSVYKFNINLIGI
jgi:DNA primase